jgi:arginine-tRNA-protein transferase
VFSTAFKTIDFCTLDTPCAYLPNRQARMQYKYIQGASQNLCTALTHRGWRRFGEYYSRPQCKNCAECLSLRIDASNFHFSKNAKRTIKRNSNTQVYIRPPTVTKSHLDLYNRYHTYKEAKNGWKHYALSMQSYYELYVAGHGAFGKEMLYFVDGKLVAVDLVDILEDGISSIYCFYDPDLPHLSLGRYSLYRQILYCKSLNLRWIYIGYYVKNCPSLAYKAHYKPYEILQNNPDLQTKPIWQ